MNATFQPPLFSDNDCGHIKTLLPKMFGRELNDVTKHRLRWHIAHCPTCHDAYWQALMDIESMEPIAAHTLPSESIPSIALYGEYLRAHSQWSGVDWPVIRSGAGGGCQPSEWQFYQLALRLFLLGRRRHGLRGHLGEGDTCSPQVVVPLLTATWEETGERLTCRVVEQPHVTRDGCFRLALEIPPHRFAEYTGGCLLNIQQEHPPLLLRGRVEAQQDADTSLLIISTSQFPVQQDMALRFGSNDIRYFLKPALEPEEGSASAISAATEPVENSPTPSPETQGDFGISLSLIEEPAPSSNARPLVPAQVSGSERSPASGTPAASDIPDISLVDDRYLVYQLIPGWDLDRVRSARMLVVGVGALGNEVVKNLALMGIGHIVIIDFDTVAIDNLSRSVLFRAEDAGKRKVDVVQQRAREINPDVEVLPLHEDIHRMGLGIYRRMDVVIACIDSFAGRQAVNEACWAMGKPWVDGGLGDENMPFDGYVHGFVPDPQAACFECTLNAAQLATMDLRQSCGLLAQRLQQQRKIPTTPTCASVIGALQAQEALKMLHGNCTLVNKRFYLPGTTYETFLQTFLVNPECGTHLSAPGGPVYELPEARAETTTVRELLEATGETLKAPDAVLCLSEEFIVTIRCPSCDPVAREVLRPLSALGPDERVCPRCNSPYVFEGLHEFSREGPLADWPLMRLGVPPLHIVMVRTGSRETGFRFGSFELTGDAAQILPFSAAS